MCTRAPLPSDMTPSQDFQICVVLFCTLLGSPAVTCLSHRNLEKRDTVDGQEIQGSFIEVATDGTQALIPDARAFQLTPSTVAKATVQSDGTSSNNIMAVKEDLQDSPSLLGDSAVSDRSLGINSSSLIVGPSPSGQAKTSSENGILTTAVTTLDYISEAPFLITTTEADPNKSLLSTNEKNTETAVSKIENSSQVNTMEMLTTNPRTSNIKAEDIQSTMQLSLDDQIVISTDDSIIKQVASSDRSSMTLVSVENSLSSYNDLETATFVNTDDKSDVSTLSLGYEDWVDTKITSPVTLDVNALNSATPKSNTGIPTTGENTLFSTSPGLTVQSETENMAAAPSQHGVLEFDEPLSETNVSSVQYYNNSAPLLTTTFAINQNTEFSAAYKGAKEQSPDTNESVNYTTEDAILMDGTNQETTTREAGAADKSGETGSHESVFGSVTTHVVDPDNAMNNSSTTAHMSPAAVPGVEDLNRMAEEEAPLSISESTTLLAAITTEVEKTTTASMVTSASVSSQIAAMVPSAGRESSTVAYGADKLESEEGDDEEDEEEVDDEDDEGDDDEEEEEEEKDTDSEDESVEGDSDPPPFTLPGLSSQEPLDDERNVVLMEGAAYQVPDALEWEKQNQGLVRSWMEKLKDKAGYMSGMLVPVGVGIAGALLILGALYSLKIMNRRRRNGFKRHKRKREFNSMQDRVMLLADSSEDEF